MPLSTFLDGRNYTRLRGAAWLALSDTGHVLAGSVADDGGGGGTTVWTAGATIPCRVSPITGAEQLVAERVSDRSTHQILVPSGTDIDAGGRFVIDNRGTFEITAARERTREWIRTLEAVEA
jgi:head-tail adaptor